MENKLRGLCFLNVVILLLGTTPIDAQSRWQNTDEPTDTNVDMHVWADDAMAVINYINQDGSLTGQIPESFDPPPFVDVNGDDFASPLDVLLIVNAIEQTMPRVPPEDPITTDQPGFRVRLEAADESGNPLAEVHVGESFFLQAYVADERPDPQGVFAAYLDILYRQEYVESAGPAVFSDTYASGHSGSTETPGLLDHVGGMDGLSPLGPGEFLFFSSPFRATAPGRATFSLDEAESVGLLYGIDPFVPTAATSAEILVIPEPASFVITAVAFLVAITRIRTSVVGPGRPVALCSWARRRITPCRSSLGRPDLPTPTAVRGGGRSTTTTAAAATHS